jgi:hypothetical protein
MIPYSITATGTLSSNDWCIHEPSHILQNIPFYANYSEYVVLENHYRKQNCKNITMLLTCWERDNREKQNRRRAAAGSPYASSGEDTGGTAGHLIRIGQDAISLALRARERHQH